MVPSVTDATEISAPVASERYYPRQVERVQVVSSETRSSAVGWQAVYRKHLVRLADDLLSQFFSAHAKAET